MTEEFILAANMLLSRRLKNLLRIDDNVEIDMSYITCAEYQLFIDEKREAGKNCQPDHWKSYSFPRGDAKKPISGVRASDAEEFCEWLTQRYSTPGFKYRLPTLAEAEEHRATEKQIGCWCNDKGEKAIAGIEAVQWQAWRSDLDDILSRDLKAVDALVHALVLDEVRIVALARKFDSCGTFGITDALNRVDVSKIAANLTNQLNIINSSYTFNLTTTLAEDNVCDVNFINHINCSGDEILIAESLNKDKIDKIGQNKTEINGINDKINYYQRTLDITCEKLKYCQKKHKERRENFAKSSQYSDKYNSLICSIHIWESYSIHTQNYFRKLEKYQQKALEDTATLKIKLLDTIEKQLTEAGNYIEIENYIRVLDPADSEIIKRQLNEVRNQFSKLKGYRTQIEAISDTEHSQIELSEIMNRQLNEARNQFIQLLEDDRQIQILADAASLAKKLNEADNQDRKQDLIRKQEVTSLEKEVGECKKAIADAEKRKIELMENCGKYEKCRSAFDASLGVATNRSYWLFIIVLWDLLSRKDKKDDAWNFYEFLVLRDARRVGQIPAWEGIRVVRERMQQ